MVVGGQDRAGFDTEAVLALNYMPAGLRGVEGVTLAGSFVFLLLPIPRTWTLMVLDAQFMADIALAVGVLVCAFRIVAPDFDRHLVAK